MKKFASLFLILSLFYNVLGFYVMFVDQKQQKWVTSMEKIDDSQFEVIKIKINPYAYIEDSGFEKVNEDMLVNNKIYHVFKNRIRQNVLELYCLKNTHQTRISNDLKKTLDNHLFDNPKDNPIKKTFKLVLLDYIPSDVIDFKTNCTLATLAGKISFLPKTDLLPGFYTINYSPPDFV